MKDLNLYERLFLECLRIRLAEEKVVELYPSDKIQSPVHLSIGQEAVAAAICEPLRGSDPLFGSYRSHAFYLAKGGSMREMFAELYGKSGGCAGGKAGSMHLTAPEVGFMGSSAVVASTIPHAVGAALAAKRRATDQIVVAVFGDGATEEGVYHESLNFAVLHSLPVVFVCENNGLAVHSHIGARQTYSITEHAKTYGIPSHRCEQGWDPLLIHAAFTPIAAAVRAGSGPQLFECRTYRYFEHVGIGDDHQVGYRPPDALRAWQDKDPLIQDRTLREKLEPRVRAEIEDAVAFAEASPWPGPEDLLSDVA
jgi:TPP-dependent pyruvate/acetoin dehydrogenase alpha subunit